MIKSVLYIFMVMIIASAAIQYKFEDDDHRKKIVVIDTPIAEHQVNAPYMCKNGTVSSVMGYSSYLSVLKQKFVSFIFRHGENVVGIIASKIDQSKYCIYHIAWYHPGLLTSNGNADVKYYTDALDQVFKLKHVVAVNLSLSNNLNYQSLYSIKEEQSLNKLTKSGIKVIVAIGNKNFDLPETNCYVYPACLQPKMEKPMNFFVVGGKSVSLAVHSPISNYSKYLRVDLEDWVLQGNPQFTGTSQATANFTGKMFSK